MSTYGPAVNSLRQALGAFHLASRALGYFFPPFHQLIPSVRNRNGLLRIVRKAICDKREYIEMAIHSSELMPGGSPAFPSDRDIEILYDNLRALFDEIATSFEGTTLKEYYRRVTQCQ
jgi:hypothetical protein